MEWVAISYSKGSSQPKDQTRISCTSYTGQREILYHCATWEAKGYLGRKQKSKLIVQFSSVTQSCLLLCDPMDCSTPGLPVHHQLPEFTQTQVHWVGDVIQPSHPLHPLLLLPPIFPSMRVFSNESVLCIRWPKYWSFSFSIHPSNEYSGLICFTMDWLDHWGTLKSLLQHHSSKASILQHSAFIEETAISGQGVNMKI